MDATKEHRGPNRDCEPTRDCRTPSTCDPCEVAVERNHYFNGKYLAARDFRTEQDYLIGHLRLQARFTIGHGIVCGLGVEGHRNRECADRWVVVRAGIAYDCYGRAIQLCEDVPLEIPFPAPEPCEEPPADDCDERELERDPKDSASDDERDQERGQQRRHDDGEQKADDDCEPPEPGPLLLVIRYRECFTEHVPALYSDGSCDPNRDQPNRIREEPEIALVRLDEVPEGCWSVDPCDDEAADRCSTADQKGEPGAAHKSRSCAPHCPCGDWVPLALLFPGGRPGTPVRIELDGRRYVRLPRGALTQIVDFNWCHGDELSVRRLRKDMDRTLRVRFDRPLKEFPGDSGRGINCYTFTVEYRFRDRGSNLESIDPLRVEFDEERCEAVFEFGKQTLEDFRRSPNRDLFVRIHGNYLEDSDGRVPDVDLMRGRAPTGNGSPGGTFFSWIRLVDEGGAS